MDKIKASDIPWMEDAFENAARSTVTTLPEIKLIEEQSNQVTTVVIFVISAILTITVLFGIAIFIDCRQEKLIKLTARRKPKRKLFKLKLPIVASGAGRAVREDEDSFADKMQENIPSTSHDVIV